MLTFYIKNEFMYFSSFLSTLRIDLRGHTESSGDQYVRHACCKLIRTVILPFILSLNVLDGGETETPGRGWTSGT